DYALAERKEFILFYQLEEGRRKIELKAWLVKSQGQKVKSVNATYEGDGNVRRGDVALTDHGTVYLPALRTPGVKDYAGDGVLLQLDSEGYRFAVVPLPVADVFLGSIFMRMAGSSGNLVLAGFYSDAKNGQYDGVFFTTYDPATGSFQPMKQMP